MKRYHHFLLEQNFFPEGLPPEFPASYPARNMDFLSPSMIIRQMLSMSPVPRLPQRAYTQILLQHPPWKNSFLLASRESALPFADCAPIPFSGHTLHRGGAISHTPGEYMFLLKEPGIYKIFYSVSVSNADGSFQKQQEPCNRSGKPIPETFCEQTFVATEQTLCISTVTAVSITDPPVPVWCIMNLPTFPITQCTLLLHKVCN